MVASTEHLGSLRSLQRLLLVGNRVDSVGELSELPQLSDLDLKFNYITKMAEVRKLAHNPQLRSLMLHGNPVAKLPTYRAGHLDGWQASSSPCLTRRGFTM